jgi:hypothetical protein
MCVYKLMILRGECHHGRLRNCTSALAYGVVSHHSPESLRKTKENSVNIFSCQLLAIWLQTSKYMGSRICIYKHSIVCVQTSDLWNTNYQRINFSTRESFACNWTFPLKFNVWYWDMGLYMFRFQHPIVQILSLQTKFQAPYFLRNA